MSSKDSFSVSSSDLKSMDVSTKVILEDYLLNHTESQTNNIEDDSSGFGEYLLNNLESPINNKNDKPEFEENPTEILNPTFDSTENIDSDHKEVIEWVDKFIQSHKNEFIQEGTSNSGFSSKSNSQTQLLLPKNPIETLIPKNIESPSNILSASAIEKDLEFKHDKSLYEKLYQHLQSFDLQPDEIREILHLNDSGKIDARLVMQYHLFLERKFLESTKNRIMHEIEKLEQEKEIYRESLGYSPSVSDSEDEMEYTSLHREFENPEDVNHNSSSDLDTRMNHNNIEETANTNINTGVLDLDYNHTDFLKLLDEYSKQSIYLNTNSYEKSIDIGEKSNQKRVYSSDEYSEYSNDEFGNTDYMNGNGCSDEGENDDDEDDPDVALQNLKALIKEYESNSGNKE
ncbi:hypothetical protein BB558_004167 [Smittium angustum]|uniref:Uncharacterized protein n=1 Tax=Smittium angustum TaxID=133377 RepID=A0A2U1J434_SMIAN|nr:hypothetical protein BB558_004167 [Smittium angustum]